MPDPWLPAGGAPLCRPATPIQVFRKRGGTTIPLPSLRCVQIAQQLGSNPGTAVFRYAFDGTNDQSPQALEEALDTAFTGDEVVEPGDRLQVQAQRPDGTWEWIFDGEPLIFTGTLAPGQEQVTLSAVGIAKRLFDTPVGGAYMRPADIPDSADEDFETDIPAQFNPRGRPNASPEDADAGTDPEKYPVFIGPVAGDKINGATLRAWDLVLATRYLMYRHNDEAFVKNYEGPPALSDMLVSKVPIDGTPFDPENAASYTTKPIIVPDTPLTGRDWPSLLYEMIRDYNFGMCYRLAPDGTTPTTALDIFPMQAGTPKQLYLQAAGATLDPELSNVGGGQLARDLTDVANQWEVEGGLNRYETSFLLAPAFPMATGDGSATQLAQYERSSAGFDSRRDLYRTYVLDETGEGHYQAGTSTQYKLVPNLDAVFGADKYVVRRRKPIGELLTLDSNGKPMRARLHISKDFAGTTPGTWDGTGTWQLVEGGWELLKDRIGIRITVENPNRWQIGRSDQTGTPYPVGIVRGVEDQCTAGATNFKLMLTCVVEGDQVLRQTATRRTNCPVSQTITRKIDARDRYMKSEISTYTWFNKTDNPITSPYATTPDGFETQVRDDTDAARAEAEAVRYATDNGRFDATITIPRFTYYYEVGDRIDRIQGRDLGLRTNSGGAADDAPVYPVVIAVTHQFEPRQTTTLTLSDAGTDRSQYRRAMAEKEDTDV